MKKAETKTDPYWEGSDFRHGDRVTDGIQFGNVTGRPMIGWLRVYWNSTGDLHNETVTEGDVRKVEEKS